MEGVKTLGQICYEAFGLRSPWAELAPVAQKSWEDSAIAAARGYWQAIEARATGQYGTLVECERYVQAVEAYDGPESSAARDARYRIQGDVVKILLAQGMLPKADEVN